MADSLPGPDQGMLNLENFGSEHHTEPEPPNDGHSLLSGSHLISSDVGLVSSVDHGPSSVPHPVNSMIMPVLRTPDPFQDGARLSYDQGPSVSSIDNTPDSETCSRFKTLYLQMWNCIGYSYQNESTTNELMDVLNRFKGTAGSEAMHGHHPALPRPAGLGDAGDLR